MTISYQWLSEYLPEKIEPEKLAHILTSIGLEVESMEKYEEVKGGLQGLVIGEVLDCSKHPDADKLSITRVDTGSGEPLQIVCGAPNVAKGQKVVVATVGTTIYPAGGEPLTMKKAKIRGAESFGMICAEDEIGLGTSHAGILVLPDNVVTGTAAKDYFGTYNDYVYEIGLTPNRMDAMSHLGVARDVCAWLSHHHQSAAVVKSPFEQPFIPAAKPPKINIRIENTESCRRYAGVLIEGVTVKDSPKWLQQRLKSIGLRPINNIVDITNFILHETGQPLHAFDAQTISSNNVVVKTMPDNTPFITLDEKERKLHAEDLMICNGDVPMCMAGVYGGLHSGVTGATKNIFLESAWFNPVSIRKTSFRHGLRTDAATRFEKGVDISHTVNVLKRAALLITTIAGGEIITDIQDVYPTSQPKKQVTLTWQYLKKLSGKYYAPEAVKNILAALGFEIMSESSEDITVAVPYSKPDISLPPDIVEEIMRIDGLDNIEIPMSITIAPAVETLAFEAACREKVAASLAGAGFNEIFTNSITNAAYYPETVLQTAVKMINSLSAELNIMRPAMLETGLESVAHNLNRKNNDLNFFEFGKTYALKENGQYAEAQHLSLYSTGKRTQDSWKATTTKTDYYFVKGVVNTVLSMLGLKAGEVIRENSDSLDDSLKITVQHEVVAIIGAVNKKILAAFDIKQPVFYADIYWDKLVLISKKRKISFTGISKFPAVQRDLAIVVDKSVVYAQVEKATTAAKTGKLQSMHLFDVFENEKLGAGKKSMAVSFTFLDEEKTMTDKEIDGMMGKIIASYEKELNAEIRK